MDPVEQALRHAERLIEERGWMSSGVGATATSKSFTYTAGLYITFERHPEFIVFGLPFGTSHLMFGTLVERLEAGERFAHADVVKDVAQGYAMALIGVENSSTHLTMSNALHRRRSGGPMPWVPALQLVFPDRNHRWPWDPESLPRTSPLLGPVPATLR